VAELQEIARKFRPRQMGCVDTSRTPGMFRRNWDMFQLTIVPAFRVMALLQASYHRDTWHFDSETHATCHHLLCCNLANCHATAFRSF
jgi:hypothetical protein